MNDDAIIRIRPQGLPIRGGDIACIYEWNDEDGLASQAHELCILVRREGQLYCYEYELTLWKKELAAAMEALGLDIDVEEMAKGCGFDFHSVVHYPPQDKGKPFYLVISRRGQRLRALEKRPQKRGLWAVLCRAWVRYWAERDEDVLIRPNYAALSFGDELRAADKDEP